MTTKKTTRAKPASKPKSTAAPEKKTAATGKDSVDWAKLKHARGAAKLVPTVIAALADRGKKGDDALAALTEAFVGKGVAYSASGPAFASLVEIVGRLEEERRGQVLALLVEMLSLGEADALARAGFDLSDAKLRKRYASPDASALVRIATTAASGLLPLLSDENPRVRGAAAMLAGWLPGAAPQLVSALLARLPLEKNAEAAVRTVFASAYLAATSEAEAAPIRSALGAMQADAALDAATRGASMIGLAFLDRSSASLRHSSLVSFFVSATTLPSSPFPSVGDVAMSLLGEGPVGDGRNAVAVAALEALVATKPVLGTPARASWPSRVLGWYFPPRKGGPEAFVKDPLDVAKLPKHERALLELLSSFPNEAEGYESAGLPMNIRARRRLLGLEPASPLEEPVPVGKTTAPRWTVLRPVLEKYRNLDPAKRRPLSDYLDKTAFDLTPARWLELWTEVQADCYRLSTQNAPIVAAIESAPTSVVSAWVEKYVLEIVDGLDPRLGERIAWFVLLPIVRSLGAGESLPEAYDAAVRLTGPIENVRQILEKIPPARRERVVVGLIEEHRGRAPLQRLALLERIAKNFLDLVPEATGAILRELDRPENDYIRSVSGGVEAGFTQHRKKVPRVDAILREHAKKRS